MFGLFQSRNTPHPVELNLLELASAEEIARATRIAEAWRAYHGQYQKPLAVRAGAPDDNVLINYAKVIVDKGVAFLFGRDVRFELDETADTEAERWLESCWQFNRKNVLLQKLALNGAIAGHAFIKIVPGQPYPRLVVLDPATMSVVWDEDDIDTVLSYKIQYPSIDAQGKPVTVRQLIEREDGSWRITDQRAPAGSSGWQTTGVTAWPYPWPPIVDCQNLPLPNVYWGLSDLEEDVLHINDSLNFVVSNIQRIIRHHAHPKTWGRGFNAQQLKMSVDEILVLANEEAELRNLEMQSDLGSSVTFARMLQEVLHEVSRVPEIATGKLERVGQLAGVALQILYQPLVEKTEVKRHTYGGLLVELNRRLLTLGGFGDNLITTLHWPKLIPGDPEAEARMMLMWQQLGVSQDTIMRRLGLDPEQELLKRGGQPAPDKPVRFTQTGDRFFVYPPPQEPNEPRDIGE